MNNVVFQVNIKGHRAKSEFDLSTISWSKWCNKNNFNHFVLTEPILELEYMNANWHKFYVFKLLENEGIDYNQVCIVDADTIVHPNCPNFFDEVDNKFGVVQSDGCYEWVNRSIEKYHNFLFADVKLNTWNYFNSGFMVLHKSHKNFCDKVYEFYNSNRDKIVEAQQKFMVGTDQTPINFLTRRHNVELKWLPNSFNLHDPFRKNLLHIDPTNWWPDTLDNLFNSGWVYHFNSIPQNRMSRDASYWMKRTFEELYK
tara:strand:+ start:215 stop:982 length:768 start_codon:yes stop_codon:yes gene_type:complete